MFDALSSLLTFDLFGPETEPRVGAAVHFFVVDVAETLVLLMILSTLKSVTADCFQRPRAVHAYVADMGPRELLDDAQRDVSLPLG